MCIVDSVTQTMGVALIDSGSCSLVTGKLTASFWFRRLTFGWVICIISIQLATKST